MLFSDFPEDIILEVMNHLVLPDHMSLLTTCSSIYRLSQQRSFWISVLDTTRKTSTIACPRFTPLSEYNLESLKEFVFSWLRLQKNWSKPYPLIRQPATFTVLSEPAEIILTVPGTDILLLHLKESGVIICWDVKMANLFSFLPVTTGGRIDGISAPSESYGIYVVAIQTIQAKAPFTGRRLLLTIKHENRKATSFESVFSDMLPETGSHFSSLFVTEHVVGSVVVRERQEHCTIVSSNLHSNNQNFVSSINLHREVSRFNVTHFLNLQWLFRSLMNGISLSALRFVAIFSICSKTASRFKSNTYRAKASPLAAVRNPPYTNLIFLHLTTPASRSASSSRAHPSTASVRFSSVWAMGTRQPRRSPSLSL
ncbi:hypothetical protein DFH09DRAFT_222100 [Mycena vulgaris]|nr:hypothetical protein DFH09DRAFT_222100 [Mycena vulgaris]